RVIIIGLRHDIADNLRDSVLPRLSLRNPPVTVGDLIGTMPRLRSGLSRNDNPDAWRETILNATEIVTREAGGVSEEFRGEFAAAVLEAGTTLETTPVPKRSADHGAGLPNSCPTWLRDWLTDANLERLPNNETRGHMASDLA